MNAQAHALPSIQLVTLPPVLTQAQFAAFTGTTKLTVKGWINNKTIPSVKIGKQRFVDVVNLVEQLKLGREVFCAQDFAPG